jgi:3-methylfumaryl-CoA hydratase
VITINETEFARYKTWVGCQTVTTDEISETVISRIAAAIDSHVPADGKVPPMWHYGLFLNSVHTAQLGKDGHPPKGSAMPPVRLPRRMFAASTMDFVAPLKVGQTSTRKSTVISVDLKAGRHGDIVFVRINDKVVQGGALCIDETRTIAYMNFGPPTSIVEPVAGYKSGAELWEPDSVGLFRFSAVTFNAHRIHYDADYAKNVEGYPDIVVQGPFTALKLCELAFKKRPETRKFQFRGEAPLFSGQPVRLSAQEEDGVLNLEATRCDGTRAMFATAI